MLSLKQELIFFKCYLEKFQGPLNFSKLIFGHVEKSYLCLNMGTVNVDYPILSTDLNVGLLILINQVF